MQKILYQLAVVVLLIATCSAGSKKYDDVCAEPGDCENHLKCLSKKCACADGHVISSDRKKCLKGAVAHGGECEENQQCKAGMECKEGMCKCKIKHHWDQAKDSCVPDAGAVAHGGECEEDQQCKAGMECKEGMCKCKIKHHVGNSNESCVPDVAKKYDDVCAEPDDCGTHFKCLSKKCACDKGHVVSSDHKQCLKGAVAHGEQCKENQQCKSGMECKEGVCKCKVKHHWDQAKVSCVSDVGSGLRSVLAVILLSLLLGKVTSW